MRKLAFIALLLSGCATDSLRTALDRVHNGRPDHVYPVSQFYQGEDLEDRIDDLETKVQEAADQAQFDAWQTQFDVWDARYNAELDAELRSYQEQ